MRLRLLKTITGTLTGFQGIANGEDRRASTRGLPPHVPGFCNAFPFNNGDPREAILRRSAEKTHDPVTRAVLSRLADRCAMKASKSAEPAVSSDNNERRRRLQAASSLMDEALVMLDDSNCDLPATRLAEAIECLNLTIARDAISG